MAGRVRALYLKRMKNDLNLSRVGGLEKSLGILNDDIDLFP